MFYFFCFFLLLKVWKVIIERKVNIRIKVVFVFFCVEKKIRNLCIVLILKLIGDGELGVRKGKKKIYYWCCEYFFIMIFMFIKDFFMLWKLWLFCFCLFVIYFVCCSDEIKCVLRFVLLWIFNVVMWKICVL